jgi:hypothetical protein
MGVAVVARALWVLVAAAPGPAPVNPRMVIGIYVGQTPGSGRRRCVLNLWKEAAPALTGAIAISTMICEVR